MTETIGVAKPPIVVGPVQGGHPPFRVVEIMGTVVGKAFDIVDVIEFARRAGLEDVDLDDPAVVTWVRGDQYTWGPRT